MATEKPNSSEPKPEPSIGPSPSYATPRPTPDEPRPFPEVGPTPVSEPDRYVDTLPDDPENQPEQGDILSQIDAAVAGVPDPRFAYTPYQMPGNPGPSQEALSEDDESIFAGGKVDAGMLRDSLPAILPAVCRVIQLAQNHQDRARLDAALTALGFPENVNHDDHPANQCPSKPETDGYGRQLSPHRPGMVTVHPDRARMYSALHGFAR